MRIARQAMSIEFPASFVLIACTNPCPCGLGGTACRCSDPQRQRYRRRLSAPLLDRFDLRLRVAGPGADEPGGESSAAVAARVADAVARQAARFRHMPWRRNAEVPAGALGAFLALDPDARDAWRLVVEDHQLTGRGATRILRVARTLADLDGDDALTPAHLVLAASFRQDVP